MSFSDTNTVNIYSDSAYSINGITSWADNWERNGWKTSKNEPVKNEEEWKSLIAIKRKLEKKFCKVNFIKVKGHSEDKYNAIVDRLAVEARLNGK